MEKKGIQTNIGNLKGNSYSRKDLEAEREQLAAALPEQGEQQTEKRQPPRTQKQQNMEL